MEWPPPRRRFQGFLQGGFEATSLRWWDGRQLDVIAATRHDAMAAEDYRLLRGAGLHTARDGLRWHLIERSPGQYDWSSFLPMLRAARDTGMQVVWDLCHYGTPADLDVWSNAFVDRFAAFAGAAARLAQAEGAGPGLWCPMNEMSFWAWIGGDRGHMHPGAQGRGDDLKRQLARAAIAAMHAVLAVDPRACFMHPEPLIHITAHPDRPWDRDAVENYRQAQFHAWDMVCGRLHPELGGEPRLLDVVGVNYYFNNQWVHEFETMGMGHRLSRPLHDMLAEVHGRYGRPIVISETGAEGANGPGWLHYVGGEVRTALRHGIPVEGICIYPVMDYPGWVDSRHCPAGLIRLDDGYQARSVDREMALAIEEQAMLLAPLLDAAPLIGIAAE